MLPINIINNNIINTSIVNINIITLNNINLITIIININIINLTQCPWAYAMLPVFGVGRWLNGNALARRSEGSMPVTH